MATDLETLTVRMEVDNSGLFVGLSQVEKSFNKHAKTVDKTMSTIDKRLEKTNQSFVNFSRNITSTLAAGLGAREIIKASDSFVNYDNRLKSVTKTVADYNKAQTETFRIAQETKQRLGDVISLYAGLEGSFTSAQKVAFPVLDITERLGKAFLVTGVQAQNAQAFILQLSQASAADFKAVGQEINSLIESAPALTKAISEELGLKSASAIKKFAEDGKLNVNNFFEAFKRATDKMSDQAGSMTVTVEQSLIRLDNAFIKFIGQQDTISGATGLLATGINKLADNFDLLGNSALLLVGVMGGRLVSSVVATTVAFTANQIALYKTAASARLVAPAYLGIASSATAAAGATTLLSRSMAFFGGPIGLAITGLAVGMAFLGDETDDAADSQRLYNEQIDKAKDFYDELLIATKERKKELRNEQQAQLDLAEAKLKDAQATLEQAKAERDKRLAAAGGSFEGIGIGSGIAGAASASRKLKAEQADNIFKGAEASLKKQIRLIEDLRRVKNTGLTEEEEKQKKINDAKSELAKKERERLAKIEEEERKRDQAKLASEKKLKAELKAQAKLRERLKEATTDNQQAAEQAQMLAVANDNSADAYEKLNAELEIKNKLQQQGFKVGTKLYEVNEKLLKSEADALEHIDATNKAREEQINAAEEYAEAMRRPIENALESIQDTISDTFVGVFDGSVKDAGDAADAIKKIFIRMAAEIATLELFGADGINIAGSVRGGALGSSSGTSGGGGFGLSNIGSLFSSLNGSGSSLTGTLLGRGIDSIGSSLGLSNAQFIGPMPAGQTAGISGAFTGSAALAGMGGNIGANLLLGNRGIGADIGGALGGVGGTLVGANMGTILGFAGGPAGALIGAFAGNAIGGLFGNKKPKSIASNFGGTINAQGGLNNEVIRTNGKGDPETAKALSQGVQEVAKALINSGIDVSGQIIQGGIDANKGFLGVGNVDYLSLRDGGGNAINFNPNGGEEAVSQAMAELALQLAKASEEGIAFADKLEKIQTQGRKAEDVLSDINFVMNFDKLGEVPQTFTELEIAVKIMAAEFDAAAATADRLGLSVDKVREAEQKRMNELLGGITSDIASQILQLTSPLEAQIQAERNRYAAQLRDLTAVGAAQKDLQMAELLHKLNIEQINESIAQKEDDRLKTAQSLENRFSRIQDNLKGFLFELTNGQYSPLSPTANLTDIRDQVQDLGNRAMLGDIDAQERLGELLPAFVQLSGEVNGFNAAFEKDRQLAEDLTRNTITVAERQVSLQQAQISAIQSQTAITASGFVGLEAAIARLGGGVSASGIISAAGAGLSNAETWATQWGRSRGKLSGSEVAQGGLLASRLTNAEMAQFNIDKQIAGFANGGLVGGIEGLDKNIARLTKGEFVMNAAAVRSVGVNTMQAINNGGGDFVSEVKGLRSDMQQLIKVVAMTGQINNEQLQSISNSNARMASVERAVAYRG